MSFFRPVSVFLSICCSVSLFFPSVCLFFCLCVFLSFCISASLSLCLSISLSLCLTVSQVDKQVNSSEEFSYIFVPCISVFYLNPQIGGRDFDVVLKSGRPGRLQIGIAHRPESLQSDLRRIGPFSSNESGKDFVFGAKVDLVSSTFVIMSKQICLVFF